MTEPRSRHCGFVQVAIPSPLFSLFDYRWEFDSTPLIGTRVEVPFGRRQLIGVIVSATSTSSVPANKLKSVSQFFDTESLIPEHLMVLLQWASRYYHHPIGEVLAAALPIALRQGKEATLGQREGYRLSASVLAEKTDAESTIDLLSTLRLGAVQQKLLHCIASANGSLVFASDLANISPGWRSSIKSLLDKEWVIKELTMELPSNVAVESGPELMDEQEHAVEAVCQALGVFKPFLLNGVTGSGKTEVYLRCIDAVLQRQQQVLILVPEIALTPQLMSRFQRRVTGCLVSLHSRLNETERMQNWLLATRGYADVVIGTRSAALTPMPRLGLIVIDEEHDGSLKQQDGFRYHARDLSLMRARDEACPVLMGTATPSFETLHNVTTGRYTELPLTRRAGDAKPPVMALLDIRRRRLIEGMSDRLLDAIRQHLSEGSQAIVFINRRGFAPSLLCNDCGACADCPQCDSHMTVHVNQGRLRCHHCGFERPLPEVCDTCGSGRLDKKGYGTERIAAALQEAFPDVTLARIDRDSTSRKGALEHQLALATSGDAQLLVGTQMLAKGHHFPGVTLVGILDADRGLFGTDFRALEQMGQLVTQVAGRAGRESRQGTVLIQTRNPDNLMLQTLVVQGYAKFAEQVLIDREQAQLPPYAYVALVRADAKDAQVPMRFLRDVAAKLMSVETNDLYVLGPVPAPMERMAGRYRAQLLIQASLRSQLNACLSRLTMEISSINDAKRTRWSIDVDPVDLF